MARTNAKTIENIDIWRSGIVFFYIYIYIQSKNVQFNKTYLHQRYHWEHDRHGYPK